MASIERRTTARGEKRYRVRWRIDGRRVEKWYRTEAEAKAHKAQVEFEAANGGGGIDPRRGAQTLDDYFWEWLPARVVKGRPLAPGTRIGYERLWRRNIGDQLGSRRLDSIKPETIRSWYGQVAQTASRDQAAKSYRVLHAVLTTAEADELIRRNPCRMRGAGQSNPAERPLVPTTLVLDLTAAVDTRYKALMLLAGFAGLRTGELLGLRRCDVDLLHSQVHVELQAQEVAGVGRTLLPPKSDAGRRTVVLPEAVAVALEAHLDEFTDRDTEAPVFTGPNGGPLRRATLSAQWQAAVEATKSPVGLRLHDLRHHAATMTARMPGVTTKELMARIGHASPRATLIYQHATNERDREIASFLDSQIAAAAPKKAS